MVNIKVKGKVAGTAYFKYVLEWGLKEIFSKPFLKCINRIILVNQ